MELAIPLIALGGLYISSTKNNTNGFSSQTNRNNSNNKKNTSKDGFKGNGSTKSSGFLPQLSIMNQASKEGFETAGREVNYIPNLENIPQNYPIVNEREVKNSSLFEYPDINASTDKYFNQTYYQNQNNSGVNTGNIIQDVYSLTGGFLKKDEFTHNNMVPLLVEK